MVRILCLHGMGVNAEIFASQTATLRSLLPADYEFIFVDGPGICEAAPGVENVFPGPYRCWYNTPTTRKVASAHQYVHQIIDKEGPFDGVVGFSQGAAVAASMILHHELAEPPHPRPLFQFAIFLASPIPFARTVEYGIDARKYFGLSGGVHSRPVRGGCPDKIPTYLVTDKAYLRGEAELEAKAVSELCDSFYQMFHPTVDQVRIRIPVAHIYGRQDPWRLHSKDLVSLCEDDLCFELEHDKAHEVPRGLEEEICDLIENVVAMANCG